MAKAWTERYQVATLAICGHCGEGQIHYMVRGEPPETVMCAECSNRNAEMAHRALCECEQYWPWADWQKVAWAPMFDAKQLMERPEFHRGSGPVTLTLRRP